jgi:hypothetical protein
MRDAFERLADAAALTRERVVMACAVLLMSAVLVVAYQLGGARGYLLPSGGVLGGDYLAFDKAADAAVNGEAASIYDEENLRDRLAEFADGRASPSLTWQYPPTYFLAIAPLALLDFVPGYLLWTGLTAAFFFAALRAAGFGSLFLFVALAAPSTFHAVITGQNGFLTGALLTVAALFPTRRPVLAGLAAALLTIKPQLGLLIPIVYAAGGCWRAFAVAGVGALTLALASVFAFGVKTWAAFGQSLGAAGAKLAAGALPLFKMTTPFAAARLAGLPAEVAWIVYGASAFAAAAAVALVWRRVKDDELRAAALCAGVFLATPYGYYYELIVLALPLAVIARRGVESGFLPYEQAMLSLAFLLPLFLPGEPRRIGFSLGFVVVALLAAAVVRRIAYEQPQAFTFASAARPAQAG